MSTPVRGWQTWQESIAAHGLLAAYYVTGDQTALDLALLLGRTVVDHGFYESCGWKHVYSSRYNNGQPFPYGPTSFGGVTADTYTAGDASYWSVMIAKVLALRGDERATKIATAWGIAAPKTMNEARWWALR
jgi:hypothetical protein